MAQLCGRNCVYGDVFNLSSDEMYDSILLMGNNLGLGGSCERTREMLLILRSYLKTNGSIIALQKENKLDYEKFEIQISYRDLRQRINWVTYRSDYLVDMGISMGLKTNVVTRDELHYVIEFQN